MSWQTKAVKWPSGHNFTSLMLHMSSSVPVLKRSGSVVDSAGLLLLLHPQSAIQKCHFVCRPAPILRQALVLDPSTLDIQTAPQLTTGQCQSTELLRPVCRGKIIQLFARLAGAAGGGGMEITQINAA